MPRAGRRHAHRPLRAMVGRGIVIASLLLGLGASACRPADEVAIPKKEEATETIARTEFTGRIENFFEYEPLRPGKPSRFLIHLTDLNDGAPVAQADVVLTVRRAGGSASAGEMKAKVGRVTGIYVAEVIVPAAGDYDIEFHVRNPHLDERMALTGFRGE